MNREPIAGDWSRHKSRQAVWTAAREDLKQRAIERMRKLGWDGPDYDLMIVILNEEGDL